MKKHYILFLSLLLFIPKGAIASSNELALVGEPELFEHCYTTADSDKSKDLQPVSFKIFRHKNTHLQNFYTVELIRGKTKVVSKVSIVFSEENKPQTSRTQFMSWSYISKKPLFLRLDFYRTSLSKRSPTTVKAHIIYQAIDESTKPVTPTDQIFLSRLECEQLF